MKKINIAFLSSILAVILLNFPGCDAPTDLNPPGDDFAGYIYFIDTNFTHESGYYAISIYSDSVDLCHKMPFKTDSLASINVHGAIYAAPYKMHGIPKGKYCIASTWVKYPASANDTPYILGTYGCDTNMNCTSYRRLVFPNFTGNYINIYSHADTSKRMQ